MSAPTQYIVKVQVSLPDGDQLLVYDQTGAIYFQCRAKEAPEVAALMRKLKSERAFFEATRDNKGLVAIGERVADQAW